MSNKKDQDSFTSDNSNNNSTKDSEKYTESIDRIVSNLGALTHSILDVTKDVGKDLNAKAKKLSDSWLSRIYDDEEEDGRLFEYPSFYQNRGYLEDEVKSHPIFGDLWNVFPFLQFGQFSGSFKSGSTPFGYYVYHGPSIRNYNECLTKNGKSVWDDQGYWRCLFPNSEVPVELLNFKKKYLKDEILTKEDFMSAMRKNSALDNFQGDGMVDLKEHGRFFDSYDKYLNWKNEQYNQRVKEREAKWKQLSLNKGDNFATSSSFSTSIKSDMYTDSETNEVKFTKVKTECDADGNCTVTRITKLKPVGSSVWTNEEENVEHVKKL